MESKSYNSVRKYSVIPLKELLPLPLPLSMFIDPVNLCNFRCTFCPTGDFELLGKFKRPKGSMKYDLYTKIIDDLQFMCKTNNKRLYRLHLYKDGEPLLNKNIRNMIAYAKEKKVNHFFYYNKLLCIFFSKKCMSGPNNIEKLCHHGCNPLKKYWPAFSFQKHR